MAQETLGYVKLEWTCPNCKTRNPGPQKTCTGCGAAQPQDVAFEQAAGEQAAQDEALQKIAAAGADIHCAFCGTRNPATAEVCSQCGGDLKQGMRREAGKVVGAYKPKPVEQIACAACGALNPETAERCSGCGAPLGRREAPAPAAAAGSRPAAPAWIWIAMAVLGVICLGAMIFFIASRSTAREDLAARVADVHWQTSVDVLALAPMTYSGWQAQIPGDAQIGACEDRVSSVLDSEPVGRNYNKVCGTSYVIDTGSGVGQVVQDCRFEVLEPYCEYTVQEWRVVRQMVEQGSDLSPFWSESQVRSGERLGDQNASLSVVFETDQGRYQYTPTDMNEFQRYPVGSEWILILNGFNQIVGIEPAD